MDKINEKLPPLKSFVIPGGSKSSAFLHNARTVARRCERSILALKEKEIINKEFKLEPSSLKSPGPSNYYYCKSLDTHIGFISPISDHFCLTCNRIRVTSNGIIYPCLGDNNSVDLNPFLNEQDDKKLIKILQKLIYTKPEKHFFNINEKSYIKKRYMNTTGG